MIFFFCFFLESFYRGLIKRSCTETLHRDLLCIAVNLAKRPLIAILSRRSCRETSWSVERTCQEVSYRSLASRALREILYKCQETSFRDLVQRPGEESRGLARRSFLDGLKTDLTFWDPLEISCVEISLRHLVQIALHRDLAQLPSTENLAKKSCARSSTKRFTTKGICRILPGISSFHY